MVAVTCIWINKQQEWGDVSTWEGVNVRTPCTANYACEWVRHVFVYTSALAAIIFKQKEISIETNETPRSATVVLLERDHHCEITDVKSKFQFS